MIRAIIAALLLLLGGPARAEPRGHGIAHRPPPSTKWVRAPHSGNTEEISMMEVPLTPSELTHDREVLDERQVGMELLFLTSPVGLDGSPVHFTDLALTRLVGRLALGNRFELHGLAHLLTKQPHPGGQPLFQGGALTGRAQVSARSSLFLGLANQPIAGHTGTGLELSAGWQGRRFIDRRELFGLAGGTGAQWTGLWRRSGPPPPQVVEAVTNGALQFVCADSYLGFAVELGAQLALPLWHQGRAFWLSDAPAFEARTRLDFYLATYFAIEPRWDLVLRWVILDRGDAAAPATRLPLLAGGHDQTLFVLGLSYRFGPRVP
jgi:hypothetical protein